ncbi:MAG: hypothetical protein HXY34_01935 [Candidatus Thorarchaeota archaeon]|nr:hypothetical protein [Candidatus Thorarchaeota archaeon]
MTEERVSRRRTPARLVKVGELKGTSGLVRILGIVVEAREGSALIQDLLEDEIGKAATVEVLVEGTLVVAHKYIVIGEVVEKRDSVGMGVKLAAILAHDVEGFDIKEFKRALETESRVISELVR